MRNDMQSKSAIRAIAVAAALFSCAANAQISSSATCGIPAAMPFCLMELKTGLTKVVVPSRPIQTVAVGDSNVASVKMVNWNTIVVTGKSVGTTNLILFDDEGKRLSDTTIQVVSMVDFREDPNKRSQVKVFNGVHESRSYLCDDPGNCSEEPPRPRGQISAPSAAPRGSSTQSHSIIEGPAGTETRSDTSRTTTTGE